jgi:hypothetical protein
MTLFKLGICADQNAEITICFRNKEAGGAARCDAPAWLHAFATPGYLGDT